MYVLNCIARYIQISDSTSDTQRYAANTIRDDNDYLASYESTQLIQKIIYFPTMISN